MTAKVAGSTTAVSGKAPLSRKQIILLGSTLFGMFFGAGNLIFPISLGQEAGANLVPALIGLIITGVGLPLLGVTALGISQSEGLFDMSSKVSRGFAYFFTCALYLCIGPAFAIPRNATISFQISIAPFLPHEHSPWYLALFTFLFFAFVLFFSLRPTGIVNWIGKFLNPTFLALLAVLLIVALVSPMASYQEVAPQGEYITHPFAKGFLVGYGTMDALASLAFGIILINEIRRFGQTDPVAISWTTLKSGSLMFITMSVIYALIVLIGARAVPVYGVAEDGALGLSQIAGHYFGPFGQVLLGLITTVACAKTAIGLVTACSTMFSEMFPHSLSYNAYAILFTGISFFISNIGLNNIINFSVPVLVLLYPLMMALISICLLYPWFKDKPQVFKWTIGLTLPAGLMDMLNAIVPEAHGFAGALQGLYAKLPFADVGLGWVIPALVGVAVGLVHWAIVRNKDKKETVAVAG